MSEQRTDGGPAYPIWTPDMNLGDDAGPGMSLRDWFAGQALTGIVASNGDMTLPMSEGVSVLDAMSRYWANSAECAYIIADAMLAARNGEEQ